MSGAAGYSARVVLTLIVGDKKLALSHVNPSNVIVCDTCDAIWPSDAMFIVEIDGHRQVRTVFLPKGIPKAPQRVSYI
jgi:hypothetical protein